ncbi:hypothetical protein [Corynebacterium sp. TAE3-ERU2]|uniref:hypothetical protein n=1 Tax=Corynebacterium sp. TAE3-ERU2 TaxID=2849497 RepID=UPI001C441E36|nr:hypothetical protein [Corynebacterium sp. TAE3-ERU2]MBV7302940.1 hypothetical protein [Corynebacterium sp. TAE3-ERU2]
MDIDVSQLSYEQLVELSGAVATEFRRRDAEPFVEEAKKSIVDELWVTHPDLRPQFTTEWGDEGMIPPEWVRPASIAQGYPIGAVVTHAGEAWISEKALNTDVPEDGDSWARRDALPSPGSETVPEGPPTGGDGPAPVDDPYWLPETTPTGGDGPAPVDGPYRLPESRPEDF